MHFGRRMPENKLEDPAPGMRGPLVLRVFGSFIDCLAGGSDVFADTFDRVAGRSSRGEKEGKGRKRGFHWYLHVPRRQPPIVWANAACETKFRAAEHRNRNCRLALVSQAWMQIAGAV
jgi:hypothetical protein